MYNIAEWDWTMRYLANQVPRQYIRATIDWLSCRFSNLRRRGSWVGGELRDLWVGADSSELLLADAIQDHVLICKDRDELKKLLGKDS